jgi:predicted RNA methylase
MTEQLPGMESERRDVALSMWFTPPELAKRIVQWALEPYNEHDLLSVLEPSCGQGALIRAMLDTTRIRFVRGIDVDPRNVAHCRARFEAFGGVELDQGDFLKFDPFKEYEMAVMNPPYESAQAEAHILHALKVCKRVVAHVPLTTLEGKKRREGLWSEAYLKRLAICSSRPKYGATGGATAMCTIDVVRRPEGRKAMRGRVEAGGVKVEWWI